MLRRVSASPKLARALKQQLVALDAIRRLDMPAPAELRERIQRTIRAASATPTTPCRRQTDAASIVMYEFIDQRSQVIGRLGGLVDLPEPSVSGAVAVGSSCRGGGPLSRAGGR